MEVVSADHRVGNPEARRRASDLLTRYPDLSETESAELLSFFRNSPAIDTALLTCSESLRPFIARFRSDHRRALSRWLPAEKWLVFKLFLCVAIPYAAYVFVNF